MNEGSIGYHYVGKCGSLPECCFFCDGHCRFPCSGRSMKTAVVYSLLSRGMKNCPVARILFIISTFSHGVVSCPGPFFLQTGVNENPYILVVF